jgi:hypothetical protein
MTVVLVKSALSKLLIVAVDRLGNSVAKRVALLLSP